MISDELRRALEKLNNGPLKPAGGKSVESARERSKPAPPRAAVPIDSVAPSRLLGDAHGACLVFERSLADFFPDPEPVLAPFRSVFLAGRHILGGLDPASPLGAIIAASPQSIAFLDIETLGLVGTPVFLVGLITWRDDRLLVSQFFARDYSEEPAMLAAVSAELESSPRLVTFNGKTFDLPTISDRLAAHLLAPPRVETHLDLLHESRRRFRHILPNCKLQTLEYHICRRRRYGDVSGELIPGLYHDFVATGDASAIRDILHHNALDLIAMVEILTFIALGGELVWTD